MYWENIIDSLQNGFIVADEERKILYCNPAAQSLLRIKGGYLGKDLAEMVAEARISVLLENGKDTIGELAEIHGKQCLVNRMAIFEGKNRAGTVSIIHEIYNTGQFQNIVNQFKAITESSTDGIYVVDQEGVTIYVNAAYEQITGLSRKDLIGRHMRKLEEEGYIDQSVSLLVLEKKQPQSLMQRIKGKKDVIVTGTPVFKSDGEVGLVVTSVRDVTQLNTLKKELEKAKTFSAFHHHRFQANLKDSEDMLVFKSEAMNALYRQVQQIAPFPTSILLTGPTGVGKEIIANLIHDLSDRREQPLIKINCGAIPEALLESELFGYEKGAFTGARTEGKIGLFELADGGTIFLDEIGEMPMALQVKLLRVLQEKQVFRIGGNHARKLNIRIISATNRDLREKIREGSFREDLYYRLQVVEIKIPTLRERPDDIEVITEYFFSYFRELYGVEKQLSEQTMNLLQKYQWPGNIRELKNLIENMIVSIPAQRIEPHHLPLHILDHPDNKLQTSLKQRLEQIEQRIVYEALKRSSSLRKAAVELGIDHSTLVKKLKKWERE